MKTVWLLIISGGVGISCVPEAKAQMVKGTFHPNTNSPVLIINQPTNILNLSSNRYLDSGLGNQGKMYHPGIYESRPFEMMVLIPGSDRTFDAMEARPSVAPNMPVIKPPQALKPAP